jgi:ribosomal protein S18 acetylase RimI-like enzyme
MPHAEDRASVTIGSMQPADGRAVARLHAATITEGFLLKLGLRFLAELYRGIAADPESIVLVARQTDQVVGFCAFSANVGGLYKRVLRRRLFRLGWAALPRALNPRVLREVADTLRYPAKSSVRELPPAEILSIGVDAGCQGGGVGRTLLDHALAHARRVGCDHVKVLAGAKLAGANAFYTRYGFHVAGQVVQHGEPLNAYVLELRAPDGA